MIEFTKTKARQCRFIYGDPKKVVVVMCCGKPTDEGSSWCPEHHDLVIDKEKMLKRKRPRP